MNTVTKRHINRKQQRILLIILTVAFLCSTTTFSFAAETIKKEYKFTSPTKDDPSYDAPEKIEEDGKKYKLTEINYRVEGEEEKTITNTVTETKTVKTYNKDRITTSIEHTLEDGQKVELKAKSSDIKWRETHEAAQTKQKTYSSRASVADTITSSKTDMNGDKKNITLKLSNVEEKQDKTSFTSPATFTSHTASNKKYQFNGKIITVDADAPQWAGYQEDVKAYLGLNGNTYEITGGYWTDEITQQADGTYVRHANYTGTRATTSYLATYTETSATTTIYEAEVVYEGTYEEPDPDQTYNVVAIAMYERYLGTGAKVLIGAGIVIVAVGIAAAVYAVSRRRYSEDSVIEEYGDWGDDPYDEPNDVDDPDDESN